MNALARFTLVAGLWPAGIAMAVPADYVAPMSVSSEEGPFGILFVPRYDSLSTTASQRLNDLRALDAAASEFDSEARSEALIHIDARADAVAHWIHTLQARAQSASLSPEQQSSLLDQLDLLHAESATLAAQRHRLGAAARSPDTTAVTRAPDQPAAAKELADAVAFGHDLVIEPNAQVRDAVAFGGDVIVRGLVHQDATAFGGDVVLSEDGQVLGDMHSFFGTIQRPPAPALTTPGSDIGASMPRGPSLFPLLASWLITFLAFAGAGVLTVGVAPQRVGRVAAMLEDRPLASLGTGMLGAIALLVGATLFVLTLVGIPLALVLLALLGGAWLLGFVALCQTIGDRLPIDRPGLGRWTAFLAGAALVALAGILPVFGQLALLVGSTIGIGAALATRLGGR